MLYGNEPQHAAVEQHMQAHNSYMLSYRRYSHCICGVTVNNHMLSSMTMKATMVLPSFLIEAQMISSQLTQTLLSMIFPKA